MKNYKIGDTIWSRDIVVAVDHGETDQMYKTRGNGWIHNYTVVDGEPKAEPVKPVLPKDVADELEDAKQANSNFYGFLRGCSSETYSEAGQFVFYRCGNRDTKIKLLSDAWYNGYTVEKPKLYNLVFGFDSNDHRSAFYKGFRGVIINVDTSIGDLDDLHYQFTQEQIDKYNEDFWIKNLDLNDYKVEVEE